MTNPITLGVNIDQNEKPQAVVEAGSYFAAETSGNNAYTLTGCTVAPGFDFNDFEMPTCSSLIILFPQHGDIIKRLTR